MNYNRGLQASQVKLTLGSVLQQYDYGYGTFNPSTGNVDVATNAGQIGKITSTIDSTAQWLQGFTYDKLSRLSNITEYQGGTTGTQTFSQGYTYDIYGNKRQIANSPLGLPGIAATDYDTTNNNNRFASGVATYDAAGNITTDSKFRGLTYAYDANGRQKSASNGTWTENQTYDAVGQRVQTSVGSTTRTMVYDIFGHDVADYSDSSGSTLERENIYRGGQLLANSEAGAIKYVLQDSQGSARVLVNSNGTIFARHDYLPFGEEIGSTLRPSGQGYGVADANRQKYGLTERDDTSGLDHTWFRKYESLSGRWTSPDPYGASMSIGDPQSFNRYSYVVNDPANFVDPSGLDLGLVTCRQETIISEGRVAHDRSGRVMTRWVCSAVGIGPYLGIDGDGLTQDPSKTNLGIEKPCATRGKDVRRDLRAIARMLHGTLVGAQTGKRFPGGQIDSGGQSYESAVNTLRKNGFENNYALDHPEGSGYQKKFTDGLWYHVIVEFPKNPKLDYSGGSLHTKGATPKVTAHCHSTDPEGWAHIKETIFGP